VDLSSNGLNRTLPPEVGLLSTLESLDLQLNSLRGSLPTELGNLTLLQDLSLSDNRFRGVMPESIGMLAKLTMPADQQESRRRRNPLGVWHAGPSRDYGSE
jgi:Leucine-rich repeat (LRR) protein